MKGESTKRKGDQKSAPSEGKENAMRVSNKAFFRPNSNRAQICSKLDREVEVGHLPHWDPTGTPTECTIAHRMPESDRRCVASERGDCPDPELFQ